MKTIQQPLAVLALAAFFALPASAAVTQYTSLAAFSTAVTGASAYNFEGIAPDNDFVVTSPTVGGVTFSSNGAPFVIDGINNPVYGAAFFSGQGNYANVPANAVSVTLSGFKAIGFFYGSYITQNESYSATLSTGDVFDLSTPGSAGALNFIGFVSDAATIDSVTFLSTAGENNADPTQTQGYGYAFDITSFVVGNAGVSQVPVPAAAWLFGSALTGLGLARRRKA